MKRILFVDDDPAILRSLRAAFRNDRHRWDTMFAPGGHAAMSLLAETSFDLIVSDMRMPEIDGVTLLEYVREQFPAMGRVILSGSTDHEDIRRALVCVDELLAKPCSTKQLRETIERLLARTVAPPEQLLRLAD